MSNDLRYKSSVAALVLMKYSHFYRTLRYIYLKPSMQIGANQIDRNVTALDQISCSGDDVSGPSEGVASANVRLTLSGSKYRKPVKS